MDFQNKTAIVTGAGIGIGFEIARRLAAQGAQVVLNDIDPALTQKAVAAIEAESPGRCTGMAGDSGDVDFIRQMVATTVKSGGRLDIVIANAGITLFGDFFTYQPDTFFQVLRTNLGGSFFLAQAAANQMRAQGSRGSILFTSSVVGHQALRSLAAYAMTKAALEMLAKNLVVELSQYGITVNCVAPGATLTERTTEEADYQKVWSKITPMGRAATVSDIANAALFLVSDQASHITGQSLIVDGGWTSVSTLPEGIK